ncbi:MAG: hypothetical protein LBK12_02670 [Odoribacteraceae bacterium]|jgi:hypothetical protein|nr:hypothetical protein [Odoribacteraceae bacterium]
MYKILSLRIALAGLLCFGLQACVDPDYDLDELDYDAVFNIPPVPVGSVDTAWFKTNLVEVELPGRPGTFAMEYVVKDIFTEDIVNKFFFEGAKAASLEGKIDLNIANLGSDAAILTELNVLDADNEVIGAVTIRSGSIYNAREQEFSMHIDAEAMQYMQEARGVKITFVFTGLSTVDIDLDDYLLLHGLVLKTGGMYINLDE